MSRLHGSNVSVSVAALNFDVRPTYILDARPPLSHTVYNIRVCNSKITSLTYESGRDVPEKTLPHFVPLLNIFCRLTKADTQRCPISIRILYMLLLAGNLKIVVKPAQ